VVEVEEEEESTEVLAADSKPLEVDWYGYRGDGPSDLR
jgi:hypothetical protein